MNPDPMSHREVDGLTAVQAMRPLALILMGAVLLRTAADPDLWGHARFGLDMLHTWTLPRVDPYSFTQDIQWINHEWLSQMAMGAAYASGGACGLQMLKVAILALTCVLTDGLVRRNGDAWRFGALATLAPLCCRSRPRSPQLRGVYLPDAMTVNGRLQPIGMNYYHAFWDLEPVARLGYSINVYRNPWFKGAATR